MKKWMAMAAALALVGAAVPHGFAENVYTPGTYAAQAKGFGGVVSVSVTFDEKGMTDVQVEAPDETSGIGSVAAEKLPAAILNAQSAQVDTVSGATFTSKAVISAVEAGERSEHGSGCKNGARHLYRQGLGVPHQRAADG
mgnify:CR=1 FL=1